MNTDNLLDTQGDEERAALFARLRCLKKAVGPNRNDQANMLIHACLDEKIRAGKRIIAVISHLGLDRRHVGLLLHDGIGKTWARDADGGYSNLT